MISVQLFELICTSDDETCDKTGNIILLFLMHFTLDLKTWLNYNLTLFFRSDSAITEEGHTVVATARGIFDHKGGVLESKETGKLQHSGRYSQGDI